MEAVRAQIIPKPFPSGSGSGSHLPQLGLLWTCIGLPDSVFPELCLLLIPTLWELGSVFQSRLKGCVLHQVLLLVGSAGHLAFLAPCGCEDAFPYPLPSRQYTIRQNLSTVSQRAYWSCFTNREMEAPRSHNLSEVMAGRAGRALKTPLNPSCMSSD